jgi:hypothetical protein
MATATLHPSIATALDRCELRYDARNATIDRLDDLTGLDWIVNAEPATRLINDEPLWAVLPCANDSAHGLGTCAVEGSDDLLCPVCTENLIRPQLIADAQINVEVLL